MKKRDLDKILKSGGWRKTKASGKSHAREIPERIAKKIMNTVIVLITYLITPSGN